LDERAVQSGGNGDGDGRNRQGQSFAIGDLHGEVSLLRRLIATIDPTPADRLIFLGDYLDRGEDSVATVLELVALGRRIPSTWLRGNHDAAWLEVWDRDAERFVADPDMPGAFDVWAAWEGRGGVPAAVGRFLTETVTAYEDDHAYYVHAAAQPGVPFWQTREEIRLWGTAGFLTSPYNWGNKPVIFGHEELLEPLITPTKIGLDTAAYRSGVLTALRVADRTLIQVHR
jgi:serine/threonine protein phosphatase 1